ncbi:ABC transporter permease [Bariatricus sp. SGI.154]|uniref:ABC transporter permease n=1 Tax=Bariatricus sp. SGI.154 TaxID=3420549 RepID=UPI003CFE398D
MKKARRNVQEQFMGLLLPVAVLIIWFVVTSDESMPNYVLPSPKEFAIVFWNFIFGGADASPYSGKMLENLQVSALRVAKGFAFAGIVGIIGGFLTGRVPLLRKIVDPTVQALRSVPGIGYLPLGMVWFGVGEENTLFLISLAAFFPVYLNTQEGAARVPELYLRAGRMLGAERLTLFFTVIFPATFHNVVVGLRLALGISWAYLVLGEMTGVTKGIGAIMMDGRMLGHVDIVIACMVVIAVTGKLCDWILMAVCQVFAKRLMEENSDGR